MLMFFYDVKVDDNIYVYFNIYVDIDIGIDGWCWCIKVFQPPWIPCIFNFHFRKNPPLEIPQPHVQWRARLGEEITDREAGVKSSEKVNFSNISSKHVKSLIQFADVVEIVQNRQMSTLC